MSQQGLRTREPCISAASTYDSGSGAWLSSSRIRLTLWSAAMTAALFQAWAYRHVVSSDAISYLDIARQCARGDWHSLINAYWSPLYPFALSVVFRITRPSPFWESTVAHLTNVGIFAFAFVSFEYLIANLVREHRVNSGTTDERQALPDWAMWALGDSIFICYMLLFNSLAEVHPDLCMAGLVFLAAALLVRIRTGDAPYWVYGIFGAVLGLSYLAKAVMFPVSFVFLACCLFAAKPLRRSAFHTAVALAFFALVSGPLLIGLSRAKGRLTFGDVGKINYAEFVDGAVWIAHWQGGPDGLGRPLHPTRKLLSQPPAFEFATPIGGTYPPWYDPSYWYEGIRPVFRMGNQLRAIRYTIQEYAGIVPYMGAVLAGFLALALLARSGGSLGWNLAREWSLWVPASGALALYGLVYVESRYVAVFFVLIWTSLFAGLRFAKSEAARTFAGHVVMAVVMVLCIGIAWIAARSAFRAVATQPFVSWQVAEGLHRDGIERGDRVASIGYSLSAYWAHLDGVRIVAEVPMAARELYWSASPQVQSEVLADFAKAGAKVVVADSSPRRGAQRGWREIGQTGYWVYKLQPQPAEYDGLR
jgi:hypothetical protein